MTLDKSYLIWSVVSIVVPHIVRLRLPLPFLVLHSATDKAAGIGPGLGFEARFASRTIALQEVVYPATIVCALFLLNSVRAVTNVWRERANDWLLAWDCRSADFTRGRFFEGCLPCSSSAVVAIECALSLPQPKLPLSSLKTSRPAVLAFSRLACSKLCSDSLDLRKDHVLVSMSKEYSSLLSCVTSRRPPNKKIWFSYALKEWPARGRGIGPRC